MTFTHMATAYGLVIRSDFALPELQPLAGPNSEAADASDVTILRGAVPQHLAEPTIRGGVFEATANQFLLRLEAIGSFLIENGSTITVEPTESVPEHELRVFLLGSGLGALLHQRGLLVLHAAAMHTERGAVMFCGRSGVGKSTILGAMMREGHRMIVDDVCAIDNSPDGPLVLPGYARTRVWADSARELEVDTTHLTRTRDSIEKFERQVEDFWPDALPARALYHLTSSNRRDIEITPLSAVDAFQTVVTQTYRARLVGGLETQREHFAQASAFAASVPVRRIERPEGSFALDELVAAVSFDLESLA